MSGILFFIFASCEPLNSEFWIQRNIALWPKEYNMGLRSEIPILKCLDITILSLCNSI